MVGSPRNGFTPLELPDGALTSRAPPPELGRTAPPRRPGGGRSFGTGYPAAAGSWPVGHSNAARREIGDEFFQDCLGLAQGSRFSARLAALGHRSAPVELSRGCTHETSPSRRAAPLTRRANAGPAR